MGTCYYLVSPQRQRVLCIGKLNAFEDQRAYEAGTGEFVTCGAFSDVFWDSHEDVSEDAGVQAANVSLRRLRSHMEERRGDYIFGALDAICGWMARLEIRYAFITNDCDESWFDETHTTRDWPQDDLDGRGDDVRVVWARPSLPTASPNGPSPRRR